MNEKTLKFKNIILNRKEFHKSKHPIDWSVDKIVVLDKFKHSDEGSKDFIGYKKAKLLNYCVLFYCKWMDISNILKKVVNRWINITKFGTGLKKN